MSSDPTQFLYGRRIHITQNVTAQPSYDIRPLRREDFLNPVEGDEFNHGDRHMGDVARLAAALRYHYRYNPATTVVESAIVRWAAPDLAAPMPDISIVSDLPDPSRKLTTLDLRTTPARVHALFEVTSPHFASYDLDEKVDLYRQAGVPEYWVIDAGLRPDQPQPAYRIHGWRLSGDAYLPIEPDQQGRYQSDVCRIWLAPSADQQGFDIGDARTGKPIQPGEDEEVRDQRHQAEASARAQSIADRLKF